MCRITIHRGRLDYYVRDEVMKVGIENTYKGHEYRAVPGIVYSWFL